MEYKKEDNIRKYDHWFKSDLTLTTMLLSRPCMELAYNFGKSNIYDIRDLHMQKGFEKAYIFNVLEKTVVLVYNSKQYIVNNYSKPVQYFDMFLESIIKSKHYKEHFILEDGRYCFVINFPEQHYQDFDKIIESNYKDISLGYLDKYYFGMDNLIYHLKFQTKHIKSYYSEKFKVDKKIFDTCNIGNLFSLKKELFENARLNKNNLV